MTFIIIGQIFFTLACWVFGLVMLLDIGVLLVVAAGVTFANFHHVHEIFEIVFRFWVTIIGVGVIAVAIFARVLVYMWEFYSVGIGVCACYGMVSFFAFI